MDKALAMNLGRTIAPFGAKATSQDSNKPDLQLANVEPSYCSHIAADENPYANNRKVMAMYFELAHERQTQIAPQIAMCAIFSKIHPAIYYL